MLPLALLLSFLSAGPSPAAADILPGNIWPNPTLEADSNGDGLPDNWTRGGTASMDLWDTGQRLSPSHSLSVNDTSTNSGASWNSGLIPVQSNTYYHLRFFRRYAITQGAMYLRIQFYTNATPTNPSRVLQVRGVQTNWEQMDDLLLSPGDANQIQLFINTGWNNSDLGQIWIDDISLAVQTNTVGIQRVSLMPNIPSPFLMRDWKSVATNYDNLVFNYNATGQYLPLIISNNQNPNFWLPWFSMPSYVGAGIDEPESINSMAAILGATLVGIDKSNQKGSNYVRMMVQYYNHGNQDNQGRPLDLLADKARSQLSDFWYNLFPHVLFFGLVDRYPETAALTNAYSTSAGGITMNGIMLATAQRWYEACVGLGATATNPPNFNYAGYNFITRQPYVWSWIEMEGSSGVAWLEYMAWRKFGQTNANFLQAADWALQYMQNSTSNVVYEVLVPYGALTAARMNAELGRNYDLNRFINWCFDGDEPAIGRGNWGVIADTWGGNDADGLVGTLNDNMGFAMNTFDQAGALAPIARYDQRYAHDLGKWLLNVANNSRLFYSTFLPPSQQSSPNWLNGTNDIIAYENVTGLSGTFNLYGQGGYLGFGLGGTDYALYGAAHVGILGALVGSTSDEKILQLDLLATDFFLDAAWPTYLHYNPYLAITSFTASYGSGTNDLFDIVTERFLATHVSGPTNLSLPADSAAVVVVIPTGADISIQGGRLYANGRIIDYRYAGLDVDSDGLPDWWETRYYGNPTNASPAALATNGQSNLVCYHQGLNPLGVTPVGAAGTITGLASVACGQSDVTYAISPVSGATSYAWIAPLGASIVSGQGTAIIVVNYGCNASNGMMTVWPMNSAGSGGSSGSLNLFVTHVGNAGAIAVTNIFVSGPAKTIAYTIGAVSGASTYLWTVPNGGTIISGQGTTNILVSYGCNSAFGSVTVIPANGNGCTGASNSVAVLFTSSTVGTTGPITGLTNVNVGQPSVAYSVNSVSNATIYTWSVSGDAAIVGGQGTTNILVSYGCDTAPVTVNVTPISNSGCSGASSSLGVTIMPVGAVSAINGGLGPKGGRKGWVFSVAPVSGATIYTWLLPSGCNITSGQGTTNITVDFDCQASSGNIMVIPSNASGCCGPPCIKVLAPVCLGPGGPITGSNSVNIGQTNVSYSTGPAYDAASYIWTVPADAAIVIGQNTTNIVVNWGSTSGSVTMTPTRNGTGCSGMPSPDFWVAVGGPSPPMLDSVSWSNGTFQFRVSGGSGPNYQIQMATNLIGLGGWVPQFTVTSPVLPFLWSDSNVINSPCRFYRIQLIP